MVKVYQEGDVFVSSGDDKDFGCCRCSHIIQRKEAGFKCKDRVFCEACQSDWNKENLSDNPPCHFDALRNSGEHEHIKFIRD
jgi:hypothetical protein